MAKYDIECACGHTVIKQLYGPGKDRERTIAWYKLNVICPDCRNKEAEENEKALSQRYQLEELTKGSEKQIAWAKSIRANTFLHLEYNSSKYEKLYPEAAPINKYLLPFLARFNSATLWIDNRLAFEDYKNIVRFFMSCKYPEKYTDEELDIVIAIKKKCCK